MIKINVPHSTRRYVCSFFILFMCYIFCTGFGVISAAKLGYLLGSGYGNTWHFLDHDKAKECKGRTLFEVEMQSEYVKELVAERGEPDFLYHSKDDNNIAFYIYVKDQKYITINIYKGIKSERELSSVVSCK